MSELKVFQKESFYRRILNYRKQNTIITMIGDDGIRRCFMTGIIPVVELSISWACWYCATTDAVLYNIILLAISVISGIYGIKFGVMWLSFWTAIMIDSIFDIQTIHYWLMFQTHVAPPKLVAVRGNSLFWKA